VIFQFFLFNKSAKMSTVLCFSVNMGRCVYNNEGKKMNLNDFSKWLQYNRVNNLRGSEYFPYPLKIVTSILLKVCQSVFIFPKGFPYS